MPPPYKLLFVCLGNICRSPAAHGIMDHLVREAALQDHVHIDSAGTGGWHAGALPDARMRKHAAQRGWRLDHRARQVQHTDFLERDLILVMDSQNFGDIQTFCRDHQHLVKVRHFCDFAKDRSERYVPDPYYGGADGFELVLDILENGCRHLLAHVTEQVRLKASQF